MTAANGSASWRDLPEMGPMGELVYFRPKPDTGRKVNADGASAEILFFTGVRIVRVEDAEPPKLRRRRSTRSDAPRKRRNRTS